MIGRREDGADRRPITLRLPNETLAALQITSAAIRRSTGTALGSSAIIRALISWLAETDIDTRRIRTPDDLRRHLLARVGRDARRVRPPSSEGGSFEPPVSLAGHNASPGQDEAASRPVRSPDASGPGARATRDILG